MLQKKPLEDTVNNVYYGFGLFIQYAVFAAHEALKNANLDGRFGESGNAQKINPTRVGTLISAGMGGLPEIQY